MSATGLTFGIYPLSAAGTPLGLATGPQDDYERISLAMRELGGGKRLAPRVYLIYYGPESQEKNFALADRYRQAGLLGDLVIGCMQEKEIDLDGWRGFVREVVRRYGPILTSLQVTNEPNLSFMEGSKSYVWRALIEGMTAAKAEARTLSLSLSVGFGSVPESPMAVSRFWERLAEMGGMAFAEAVDFVGHNFYVDVFEDEPLDIKEVPDAVEQTLRDLRKRLLAMGIAAPIRVTENGWPTGRNPLTGLLRPYERQTEMLETVIRTVYRLRGELNITHYLLFGLRDADSANEELFHQYGIMRDDYTPKPAYYTFQNLIEKLGA